MPSYILLLIRKQVDVAVNGKPIIGMELRIQAEIRKWNSSKQNLPLSSFFRCNSLPLHFLFLFLFL